MARRSDEPEAEPLDIVEGVIERVDLELEALQEPASTCRIARLRPSRALAAPLNSAAIAINSGSDSSGAGSVRAGRVTL